MSEALVALRGVAKRFPTGTQALDGVHLDLHAGEILTLLGPSGCGKSTILRLIAGLESPTAGTIKGAVERRDMGFVFQDATLMPWANIARNVHLPLRLRGESWHSAGPRVDAALARVGLADFAGAYPRELSGGMRMRAAIARALVTRPTLLLMDEPFAALDEIVRFRLDDDLLRLRAEEGVTVLFVTHSVFEAAYLSDRIAVLSARPGWVTELIDVKTPQPRDEFRASGDYAKLCARVSAALLTASGNGAA